MSMTNIVVEAGGDCYRCRTDFVLDGDKVGDMEIVYRADGWVDLKRVRLDDAIQGESMMTELLEDFLPHYRRWGLTKVRMGAYTEAGVAFATKQGMQPQPDDPAVYWMAVPEEG